LKLIVQPLATCSRVRVFCNGIQTENWDYVGETEVLTGRLKSGARRENDSVEAHLMTARGQTETYQTISASTSRRVMFTVPCGAFQMRKWAPLSLVSGEVALEMELSSDAAQAFDITGVGSAAGSSDWEVTDMSMFCNIHTVDSNLANSYAKAHPEWEFD
jgi:hypothetical protein